MQNDHRSNLFSFLKQRVTILQVIGEHVSLKKAGQYWKAPCPFHSEKTASFTVSPHREIFYCFGCHSGGDVITFVSKIERCSQLEAAKFLADRYNIELPQEILAQPLEQNIDEKKRYFALCEKLALWMHEQLLKNPSIMRYVKERSFTEKSIQHFKLGYLPEGMKTMKTLLHDMNKEQFLLKDILETHFIEENKGLLYSAFEQRVIFPIKDHLGRYCGFGGRIVSETDQRSKYYNSRENTHFQKGSLLFGLDFAKKEIQKTKEVFLVEGYTDCIAMVQHGYTNTVATLGTSCTLEHLKQLSYHAEKLYVVYDGDAAGQKAMLRLAEICWQVNLELYVLLLPNGKDPDEFLKEGGKIEDLKDKAQDILGLLLTTMGQEFTHKSLQQKLEGVRKCIDSIRNLQDPLKQDLLLQKASIIFDLPFASLKQELNRAQFQTKRESLVPDSHEVPINPLCPLEKNFLCVILNKTELLEKKEIGDLINYLPPEVQEIIKKLKKVDGKAEKEQFLHFFDTLDYHERMIVNGLLVYQEEVEDEEAFETVLLLLEKKYWKMIVQATREQLTQAQQVNDSKTVNEIVGSFLTLKKKLLRKGLI